MPIPLHFRLLSKNLSGLANAQKIFAKNLKGSLIGLGKNLRSSAQARMRRDTGDESKSLIIKVVGRNSSLPTGVEVYSTLVQAFVDAYGMRRGKLVPYRRGTKLYFWALRRSRGIESKPVQQRPRRKRKVSHLSRRPKADTTKGAGGRRRGKTQKISGQGNRRADKLAFLTARAIFEHGIRPTHWNKKALDANKQNIIRQLKNALARTVNEINRG